MTGFLKSCLQGRRRWCRNRRRPRRRCGALLTPDKHEIGHLSPRIWRGPMITQSVGVPRTANGVDRLRAAARDHSATTNARRRTDRAPAPRSRRRRTARGRSPDDLQARGMDAVVVGAENSHPSKCLLVQLEAGFRLWASSYPAIAAEANRPISSCFLHPDAPRARESGAPIDFHLQVRRFLLWRLDANRRRALKHLRFCWMRGLHGSGPFGLRRFKLRRFRLRGRWRRRDRLWHWTLRSYRHRPHRARRLRMSRPRNRHPCRNPRP